MLKNSIFFVALFYGSSLFGQNILVADVVVDSLVGTKDELFSKSKMFVAEIGCLHKMSFKMMTEVRV